MHHSQLTTEFLKVGDVHELAKVLGFNAYADLAYLIYPEPSYSEFKIKKKNGSEREIHVPAKLLKDLQKKLLLILTELDKSRPSVHGFLKKRSVFTNAAVHAGSKKNFIFNLDLKDFFPTITFARVQGVFRSEPFNLPLSVATVLAKACTNRAVLPQGAPTSPAISNYVCRHLDGRLQYLAKKNRATYSRYADDLTFSFTNKKRSQLPREIVDTSANMAAVGNALTIAIAEEGFAINQGKVRLRSRHVRMEVTGLTVNEFPNVQRRFIDEIRGVLHSWKKFGWAKTQEGFENRKYHRQLRAGIHPPFENVLRGKLLYLKMIKQDADKVYNSLARRFNLCIDDSPQSKTTKLPFTQLVSTEQDLEKAVFVVSCKNEMYNFEVKGTGFFLEDVGFVTCNHVLVYPVIPKDGEGKPMEWYPELLVGSPLDSINIQDIYENDICELEVIWADKNADVAVLRTKVDLDHLELKRSIVDAHSRDIKLVGFPSHSPGKSLSFADGKIRSRYASFNKQHIDVTTLIRQGNSGGPVLDANFFVIGVAKEGERQDKGNNGVLRIHEVVALHSEHLRNANKTA